LTLPAKTNVKAANKEKKMSPFIVDAVPIYAGDTAQFPSYTFSADGVATDFVAEGWSGWEATWRPFAGSEQTIEMTVDTLEANVGVIIVTASAAQTREMGRSGVFDLQAIRNVTEVKTFIAGTTSYSPDVTR
jgi:hypothetical protein